MDETPSSLTRRVKFLIAKTWADLIVINLLTLLLIIAIVLFPSNVLRIILGIPFVLLFPGYILMTALFPRKESMDNLQRVALSLGMSIAVVPLIGLILNYTPWGITLESVLGSVAAFIVIMSVITWIRRKRFPEAERFGIEFHLYMPGWGGNIWDKVLTVMLVISALGAMVAVGYTIATPKGGEKFTEFYMLSSCGEATFYPRLIIIGQDAELTVGIVNHENETVSYRLVVMLDGARQTEIRPIVLAADEKWEQAVHITPEKSGENQKVEFFLYIEGEYSPHLDPLRLWIDVIG
jgi:uncharacterized membrane protein